MGRDTVNSAKAGLPAADSVPARAADDLANDNLANDDLADDDLVDDDLAQANPDIAMLQAQSAAVNLIDKLTDTNARDIKRWFSKFEKAADFIKWDTKQRASILPLFLSGNVGAIFHAMPDQDQDDYEKVKASLIAAFADTVEPLLLREQLAARMLSPGETVKDYARAIQLLCNRINITMSDADKVAAFMKGLPRDLRTYMAMTFASSASQLTFSEAVTLACRVEAIQGSSGSAPIPKIPVLAAVVDLTGTDAPNASRSSLEESVKQLVDVIALQAAINHTARHHSPFSKRIVCYNCHKMGHRASECRDRIYNERRNFASPHYGSPRADYQPPEYCEQAHYDSPPPRVAAQRRAVPSGAERLLSPLLLSEPTNCTTAPKNNMVIGRAR